MPEDRHREGLMLDMTMTENLAMATLDKYRSGLLLLHRRMTEAGERAIASLSIQPPDGARTVKLLSGGNQQKVLVGKWLNRAPRILILDEPTVGVDVGAKAEIYAILRRERERGAAILVVSSDLEEVMTIADRIGVMVLGRLVAMHDADKTDHARDRARDRRGGGMSATSAWSLRRSGERARGQRAADGDRGDRRRASPWRSPRSSTPDNLIGIVRQVALIGIMATCTTFVIMTGGVDLSVGPVLAIAGLVSFFCLQPDLPLPMVHSRRPGGGVLVGPGNGADGCVPADCRQSSSRSLRSASCAARR